METMFPPFPSSASMPIRRLKRAEFERLTNAGCFDNERVELVFGMVVAMSPTDPAHAESVRRIDELLRQGLRGRARVSSQHPFAASDESEPEPDVFVFPVGDYWHAHPNRAYLVIEVARSSLAYDREVKAVLYAGSDVDEYWIVNQAEGVVEVYRDARDGRWRSVATCGRAETISLRAFPDVQLAIADILPPSP